MTAEIAIMNREAVALAADSAVTLSNGQGDAVKIYQSANKIFALSQHHPVGVMFYDNASISGLPWETVVKMYRRQLGARSFAGVEGYATDFFKFMSANARMFPEAPHFVNLMAGGYLQELLYPELRERVEKATHGSTGISVADLEKILQDLAEEHVARLSVRGTPTDLSPRQDAAVRRKRVRDIDNVIAQVFEAAPISQRARSALREIGHLTLTRFYNSDFEVSRTGVVIAGFGDDEVLPTVTSFDVGGVSADGYMKRRSDPVTRGGCYLRAFAQSEMVHRFMNGIDPVYSQAVQTLLTDVTTNLPDEVLKMVPNLTPGDHQAATQAVASKRPHLLTDTLQKLAKWQEQRFVLPILEVVGGLPKDELASLAEALVNLTVLKRRVTNQAETVGGPIDVAVISKGDGFIWIKRKHYFRPELNLHFTQKVLRDPGSTSASTPVKAKNEGKGHGKQEGRNAARSRRTK